MKTILEKNINTLFNINFSDLNDEDEQEKLENLAKSTVDEFGWKATFDTTNNFLRNQCKTPQSVTNFSSLYYLYDWQEYALEDPYDF